MRHPEVPCRAPRSSFAAGPRSAMLGAADLVSYRRRDAIFRAAYLLSPPKRDLPLWTCTNVHCAEFCLRCSTPQSVFADALGIDADCR